MKARPNKCMVFIDIQWILQDFLCLYFGMWYHLRTNVIVQTKPLLYANYSGFFCDSIWRHMIDIRLFRARLGLCRILILCLVLVHVLLSKVIQGMRALTSCHISLGSWCFPVQCWFGNSSGQLFRRAFGTCLRYVSRRNNCWSVCWLHWACLSNRVLWFDWIVLSPFCLYRTSYSQDTSNHRLGRSCSAVESYLYSMWKMIVLLFESGLWIQSSGLS